MAYLRREADGRPVSTILARVRTLRRDVSVVPWLLPAYLVIIGVTAYPLVSNLVLSFYGEAVVGQPTPFVGLSNYQAIITSIFFLPAVVHTLLWTAGSIAGSFCAGLGLALLLNRQFFGVRIARVLFLIPWATPSIAAAIIWTYLYNTNFGVINTQLEAIHLGILANGWVTNPNTALLSAMVVQVWRSYGFYMVLLLGGMQSVPRDTLDAATVDGARAWRRVVSVMLPQLQPVILTVILLDLIWTTNNFDTIYILTGGGPAGATQTLPLFVYLFAFQEAQFPQAAAGSVVLLVVSLIPIAIYLLVLLRLQGQSLLK